MKHSANPQTSSNKQKKLKVNQNSGSKFARPAEKIFGGNALQHSGVGLPSQLRQFKSYRPSRGLPQQEGWVYVWDRTLNTLKHLFKLPKLVPYLEIDYYATEFIFSRATLQEEIIHWDLIFAILLMQSLLNSNSAYYNVFTNSAMIT